MNKKELQAYIVLKIKEIETIKPSEKEKVCEILEDVWVKYSKVRSDKRDSELKSGLFEGSKPIQRMVIDSDIENLMNGDDSYVSSNYAQIKFTLKSIKDSM